MLFEKIRKAWKKRAAQHLIRNAGREDWCAFAKALCGSSHSCCGFPYECKSCFDTYFDPDEVINRAIKNKIKF
jgi:hypothetical protein